MRRSARLLIFLIPLALCSCTKPAAVRGDGWPPKLRYLVSISQENPEAEASRLAPIKDYLQAEMQMPVEIVASSGYGVAIEAMRAHQIEACTLGPFAYLLASEKAGAEVVVTRGKLDGSPGSYAGGFAVTAESPLKSIEDVVKQAKNLTISFVDPASASGNLVQRAYLDSARINPEKDFKKVVFAQAHMTSALTLLAGKTDVAAIGDSIIPALEKNGQVRKGALRYIWMSPPIPEGPVAVRKDLPESFKRKLRDALVAMRSKAPDAYFNMSAKVYMDRYKVLTFTPANDAVFDPLRKLARGVKSVQLLD